MPANVTKPPLDIGGTFLRVALRYQDSGRFARGYVAAKLRRDPVHRAVLALAAAEGFGDVVDIGCGRGQLDVALLVAGLARSIVGIDCRTEHLDQARRAATGLPFRSAVQDLAVAQEVPEADTVLLIDVLYQLERVVQMALVQAAARAARRRILIRMLDPDCGWRSALTLRLERLMRRVSPHSGGHVAAMPVTLAVQPLVDAGFSVSVAPCWKGTPFANVLLIAHRAR